MEEKHTEYSSALTLETPSLHVPIESFITPVIIQHVISVILLYDVHYVDCPPCELVVTTKSAYIQLDLVTEPLDTIWPIRIEDSVATFNCMIMILMNQDAECIY